MSTKLFEINSDQSTVIIEQNGEPTTVVMSYDHYQALLEQLRWSPPTPNDKLEQASAEFWRSPSLDELAQRHNVRPVRDIEEVLGPEPPEGEESADEFIAEIRQWRKTEAMSLTTPFSLEFGTGSEE